MFTEYKEEDLQLMIKKAYFTKLGNDVIYMQKSLNDMQKSLDDCHQKIKELTDINSKLVKQLNSIQSSNEYNLGKSIGKYIKDEIRSNSKNIHNIIAEDIKNNLSVNVDSKYEPYSGQTEHYHETNVMWNGETIDSIVR